MASSDDDEKKSASASKKLPLLASNLKLLDIIRLVFSEIIYFLPIVLRFHMIGRIHINKAVAVGSNVDKKSWHRFGILPYLDILQY